VAAGSHAAPDRHPKATSANKGMEAKRRRFMWIEAPVTQTTRSDEVIHPTCVTGD
jgi:hypothetical protein